MHPQMKEKLGILSYQDLLQELRENKEGNESAFVQIEPPATLARLLAGV